MCDVAESTIEEALLAALAVPEYRTSGASRQDLLGAAGRQGACALHTLSALRALLRKGHVAAQAPEGSRDAATDPAARFRIAETPAPAQPDAAAGPDEKRLGNYTYSPSDPIGRGRWGVVYRGWNAYLHRPVAIKLLSREFTDNENFQKRFAREARFLAKLDHPNIVKLYDGGQAPEGTCYLAMEYIEGGTLRQFSQKMGRVPPPLLAKFMYQAAEALAVAHRQGIFHRDVKLENLMMTQDGVKLTDFNLAGFNENAVPEVPSAFDSVASDLASPPPLVGTLAYMAPERLNGDRGDARSDIYSLGVTFYSAASGGPLFEGIAKDSNIYMTWRWHHTKEMPKPLTERVPGFPATLWAVIERALAKDPDERYSSCEELLVDLAAVRRELSPDEDFAVPAPVQARRRPRSGRSFGRRIVVAAVALGVLAFVALSILNPFKGAAAPPADRSADAKPVAVTDTRAASDAEKPASPPEKVKPPEDKATAEAPTPKPEPVPPPRLRDKLLSCPTTETTQAAMARLLDTMAGQHPQFRTLSYDGADAALQRLREELIAGEAEREDPQQEYLRSHLDATGKLIALAKGTADSGWRAMQSAPGILKIRLADGKAFEGRVESAADRALVIADERGQRLNVQPSTINPREILRDGAPAVPQLAYRALSISATDELGALLKSEEDSLLWIPVATRLARVEVHEKAKRAATKAKALLVERRAGQDFLAELPEYIDALAGVQTMCRSEQEVQSLYPYLAPEFSDARSEERALGLLLGREYSRVITSHPGTASYGPAAELILGGFQKKIAAASSELMAKTGWIGWDWRLHPPVKPPQNPLDYWRPDVQAGTSILRDPEGTHMLVMHRDHPRAPEGVVLTVGFAADEGDRPRESCWKFHLRGEKGSDTYLRFQEKKVALCRMLLKPGEDEEIASASPSPSAGDLVYALVPKGQELHVFRDGELLLTVPQSQANIPRRLAFSVVKATLTIKYVQVLKE